MRRLIKSSKQGFTLVEVLMASAILLLATLGLIIAYMRCMELSNMSQNTFIALSEAKTQMETIKNDLRVAMEDDNINVDNVVTAYDNAAFAPVIGIDGMGVSYVDDTDPDFYEITVSFSWRQGNGRIVGEDADLDGTLDAGEDTNGNGIIDSYVQLINLVYTR